MPYIPNRLRYKYHNICKSNRCSVIYDDVRKLDLNDLLAISETQRIDNSYSKQLEWRLLAIFEYLI